MKKVLSLVLAVVLVLGMSTVAFAAYPNTSDSDTAEKYQKSANKLLKLYVGDNSGYITDESFKFEGDIVVVPNAEDTLYGWNLTNTDIVSNTFASTSDYVGVYIKDDATNATTYHPLKWADVNRLDIEVKLASSSPIFKGVSLKKQTVGGEDIAVVRFEVYNYLDSASTKSFADKIYLTADGRKMTGTELELKGKFKNNTQDVDDEDVTEWDLSDGANRKLDVGVNVRNAELELDYDVFLYTTLYNGRDVYARATNIANNTQFAVMDKYNSIEEAITLYTAGLTSTTKVFFDRPEKLYVYGVDSSASYDAAADAVKLVYLGTTSEKLPLADQYFLSTKELAIETTPVEPEPSVPAESSVSNPVGGGDTTAPNANYNPGTGC